MFNKAYKLERYIIDIHMESKNMSNQEFKPIGKAVLSSSDKAIVENIELDGKKYRLVLNKQRVLNLLNGTGRYALVSIGANNQ